MICILLNHSFVNEVQTVAQLFFPNEGLTFDHIDMDEYPQGYVIKTAITVDAASAYVIKDAGIVANYTLSLNALPIHLSPRRVLMLALYHALQKAVGAYTPWGALTGIRPSKMVREWLESGWSDEKIISTLADPFCCTSEKAGLALSVARAESELTRRIYNIATPIKPFRKAGVAIPLSKGVTEACRASFGRGINMFPPTPVGIYVSIPFCPTRCVYCSFNVAHNFASPDIHAQYVTAVAQECKSQAKRLAQMGGVVSSIYIGGGTPTSLSEKLLEQLLDAFGSAFGINSGIEYSVEAGRPDTLTKHKLDILRKYGANRIAVNPQTLNDQTLSVIGRKHTAADFFRAFALARDAGFECINTDIIVGLPGETPDDVCRTMEGIASLSPENITVHTLAIKRASRLNALRNDYALPGIEDTETMLNIANATCVNTGLRPYYMYRQKNMVGMFENVGYSKPGHECLYNVGMMAETQTVLGIGAGAVSKFVEDGKISREFNVKNPEIYVERSIDT